MPDVPEYSGRIAAMIGAPRTWDLSPDDVAALRWLSEKAETLENTVAAMTEALNKIHNRYSDVRDELARIDHLKAAAAWRPIETAPKDGTHVLLYRKFEAAGSVSEAWWRLNVFGNGHEWGGCGWSYPAWDQPTHWMPLPPAPNPRKEPPCSSAS